MTGTDTDDARLHRCDPPVCTCTGPARHAHFPGCPVRQRHPRLDLGDAPRCEDCHGVCLTLAEARAMLDAGWFDFDNSRRYGKADSEDMDDSNYFADYELRAVSRMGSTGEEVIITRRTQPWGEYALTPDGDCDGGAEA